MSSKLDLQTELKIYIYGEEVLRQIADEITEFGAPLKELVQKMYKIMIDKNGVGLAAPQVGLSKRLFIVDVERKNGSLIAIVNPEIKWESQDMEIMEEGCLSLPGIYADVTRPHSVIVTGYDLDGNKIEVSGSGLFARALMHELDHLDGKVFIDYLDEKQLKKIQSGLKKLKKLRK